MTGPVSPEKMFADLPSGLRGDLLGAFDRIVTNYAQERWEPSELNGGKLCEVTYSIIRGYADGQMPERAYKPDNMVRDCRALENQTQLPRSLRISIPQLLPVLYEVRNNRNVGHVGGDVDPSHMDAVMVLQNAKWMMAELVRVFHDLPIEQASEAVESLVARDIPVIWQVGARLRVLDPALSMKEKTLLILLGAAAPLTDRELCENVEHSNFSVYRRQVLDAAHDQRLLEYNRKTGLVTISPLGIAEAEAILAVYTRHPGVLTVSGR